MLVAKVAVDHAAYHFDKRYDYALPGEYAALARVGCRVLVPFGAGSRGRQGVVLALEEQAEPSPRLKTVLLLLDEEPCLTPELLGLVEHLKDSTFCTYYDAVKTVLPAGLGYRLSTVYAVNPDRAPQEPSDQEEARIERMAAAHPKPVTLECLCEECGITPENAALCRLIAGGRLTARENATRRIGDETLTMARLRGQELPEGGKLTAKQKAVTELLREAGAASVREVGYYTGTTPAVLKTLQQKGVVELYERAVFRTPVLPGPPGDDGEAWALSPVQQRVYEGLRALWEAGGAAVSLLYGVTGSGKTRVFLRLMEDVLRDGRAVLVLVPEISLTPQTIGLFTGRFGSRVAILHSGLSMGERLDEWRRIREGRVDIAVGTRSAVFAPFERLGLIILDEEQESAYKSEQSPRYHARDVAKTRAAVHGAQLLLCSATPSVESYYHATEGRYHLFTLTGRYGGAQLPPVEVVDMDEEARAGVRSSISRALGEELTENLRRGEQSILLLNRRGYHTVVKCEVCGAAATCPNCSIGLTYHQANGRLMCHYCGHSRPPGEPCPVCGGAVARYTGAGTQKLEEELHQLYPTARILRMDADTTMAKHAYEEGFGRFAAGEYDILVGTQMVAKGLNFPKVTLVGVLAADGTLFGDNFRSEERTFSLLTQVVGRGGRGRLAGRAYLQTHFPDHEIFALAAAQDYPRFYENELATRRLMLYPPFCQLVAVGFSGLVEARTAQAALAFTTLLTGLAGREYPQLPLRVLGPTPGAVARINGKYRYKLMMKCNNTKAFRALLARALLDFGRGEGGRGVSVLVDPTFDGSL